MNPISMKEAEILPSEPRWKRAENHAKKVFEDKFGIKFSKKKLFVGRLREFDLVSSNTTIIVQIKSSEGFELLESSQHRVRFAECMLDFIILDKAKAKKKLFVIADKPLYDRFMQENKGLVSSDLEIMLIKLEE